jgi:hypothetical protein
MNAKLETARMLGEIADRQLVWTLARAIQKGDCYGLNADGCVICEAAAWESIVLKATFDSTGADTTVQAKSENPVPVEIWVRNVRVQVRRPLAFTGSVLKAQSDYYNAQNPNIDATVLVKSFCNYIVGENPIPLEHLEQEFDCRCKAGLVLKPMASIAASFTNLRALAADEIGTEVVITFSGTRLPRGLYGSCGIDQVMNDLREQGLLPRSP